MPIKLAVPPPPEPVAPGSPAQPAEKNIELPPFPDLEKPPATHKKPARPSPQAGPNFILPFDALGPAEALDRIKGVRIRGKAHFVSAVNINDITVTWQSIQRLKYEEKTATPLRSMDTGVLLKASQAWYWHGRQMRNLEGAGLTFYQNFAYSLALSNLLPLKEKGFDLEKEEAAPVRDQECYRIRVRAAGRPEMLLFFDRKTNLLCKTQFRGPFMTVGLDGNVQPQAGDTLVENYFGEYRKVRDVNHWWKWEQYRDGLKYGEINLYNVEFLEKIEEGFFSLRPLPPPPTVFRGQLTNLDPFDRRRPGSRCKVYPLQLTAGKTYQIDMVSNQLDSYLRLEDAGGRQLAEDDDGGGFPNARIIFRCEQTGNYRITCTTFAPATGSYTLTVQETGR